VKPGTADQKPGNNYVLFFIDQRSYAFPLEQVERIVRLVAFSGVPESPNWMLGVINLSGVVIPVVDIRQRFGLPRKTLRLSDRLLILQDKNRCAALVTDQVNGVLNLPESRLLSIPGVEISTKKDLQPSTGVEDQTHPSFVQGVFYHNEMLIMVLDAAPLLQAIDMPQLQADVFKNQVAVGVAVNAGNLTQIRGIGAAISRKLDSAEIHTIADLARSDPEEVADLLKFSQKRLPEIRLWIAESAERAHLLGL
jgi:purine-binding chemotaxis protein CheW